MKKEFILIEKDIFMKKSIFLLLFILISTICFGEVYTIKDSKIKVDIYIGNKVPILSQVTDLKTNTKFFNEPNNSLWTFKVKKDKDYAGEEIVLKPEDSESVTVNCKKQSFKATWTNVKNENMDAGFDVTVTCDINNGNSYWNISIDPKSKEYGIWSVIFPYISKISTEKEDTVALPIRGGCILKNLSETTFAHPYFENDKPIDFLEYAAPLFMQFESYSKGNSTLYISPEDLKCQQKWIEHRMLKPYTMDYIPENFPLFMAKVGEKFAFTSKFNIAVLEGDYYDACKKYRKWGIANKYGAFANGKLDERKDIPDWWKKNVGCMYYVGFEPQCTDSLEKTMAYLNVPLMCHVYCYNQYPMDTHYPNWLPLNDHWLSDFERIKKAGYSVVVYANGHLVDTNLSDYYKEYGDVLINKDKDGKPFHENWAEDQGAYNVVCCPDSKYKEIYGKEVCDIMKAFPFDCLYMDQVSACKPELCFNPLHENHAGGGDHWARSYRENINEYRKKLSEIKGEPVVIVTEDSTDAYPFDAWLRVNENISRNANTPFNVYVYSGYVNNFGDAYYPQEYTEDDSQPAINKTSVTFSKGIMPGWNTGYNYDFEKYPNYAKHYKNMAQGRAKAYEYFNLGEMVRPVKITSPIPTKSLYWKHYTTDGHQEFPLVRTCSFNYKGKTAVSFISVSFDPIEVTWEANAKDLNLKNPKKISEFYPNSGEYKINGKIKHTFTLQPLETVIFVVE